MQMTIHSTSSRVHQSWKQRLGLPALVLLTVAASTLFGLQILGAKPVPAASHAGSSDTLRSQQVVKDNDEAAAGASWAQMQAMERAVSTNELAATTILVGIGCGEDCLRLIWPNGQESTTSLSIAFDYAAICSCSIVMQLP
jgi:hypothetical protein